MSYNIRIEDQRIESNYELENGEVVMIAEVIVKDIDTNLFIVAGRKRIKTGKTKEQLINELTTNYNLMQTRQQDELNKLNQL